MEKSENQKTIKKESTPIKPHLVIIAIVVIILISCCIFIVCISSGLYLYNSQSKGTLRVSAFTETNKEFSNPNNVDVQINSIFTIKPAIEGRSIFTTDEKGFVEIEVPVGSYEVAPMYGAKDSAISIKVVRNTTTKVYLPIKNSAIFFLRFNCSEDSPFKNKEIRKNINSVIRRKSLLSRLSYSSNAEPAFNFVPELFSNDDWAKDASVVKEGIVENNIEIRRSKQIDFRMLTNKSAINENEDFLRIISGDLKKLKVIDTVAPIVTDWDSYLARNIDGDFEVTKMAWVYDSNNLLDFFSQFLGNGSDLNCLSGDVDKLIEKGSTALDRGDIQAYENVVLEINNLIIEDVPMVPIYYYTVLENVLNIPLEDEIPNNQLFY